jgi:hypothetical protein
MAKKVVDARVGLDWMLDRIEARPDRNPAGIIIEPEYGDMPLSADVDRFHSLLERAADVGAITIERRKRDPGLIERVRLLDAGRLYEYLKREPTGVRALAALEGVVDLFPDLPLEVVPLLDQIRGKWVVGKPALRSLEPGDADGLMIILQCILAMLRGEHLGEELKSFSLRVTGKAKSVERQAPRLAEALRTLFDVPEGARGMDVLAALGLEKFSTPVLLRCQMSVAGVGTIRALPYVGIPEEWIAALSLVEQPSYLMTVENLASFNRYTREVRDGGLVVYTGGYPSRTVVRALRRLDALLSADVPAYHWGDIDHHGFLIADFVGQQLSRSLNLHMMEKERLGNRISLEQEAFAPHPPVLEKA